jgi:AcrR family transcriptional regulator
VPEPTPRRTQTERSAATQRTLIDAATELLIERGWAATTAVAVCERAGCTRGALVHHYPNLSALLASALETIYADFVEMAEPEVASLVDALDRMWTAMSDRRFKAVLEAWSAAGNDPELAREIAPAIARFAKIVSVDNPSRPGRDPDPDVTSFVLTAREAMLGLALGRAIAGGKALPHEAVVLDRLRAEAMRLDAMPAGDVS